MWFKYTKRKSSRSYLIFNMQDFRWLPVNHHFGMFWSAGNMIVIVFSELYPVLWVFPMFYLFFQLSSCIQVLSFLPALFMHSDSIFSSSSPHTFRFFLFIQLSSYIRILSFHPALLIHSGSIFSSSYPHAFRFYLFIQLSSCIQILSFLPALLMHSGSN